MLLDLHVPLGKLGLYLSSLGSSLCLVCILLRLVDCGLGLTTLHATDSLNQAGGLHVYCAACLLDKLQPSGWVFLALDGDDELFLRSGNEPALNSGRDLGLGFFKPLLVGEHLLDLLIGVVAPAARLWLRHAHDWHLSLEVSVGRARNVPALRSNLTNGVRRGANVLQVLNARRGGACKPCLPHSHRGVDSTLGDGAQLGL